MKKALLVIFCLLLLLVSAPHARAINTPIFPSCNSPQGEVIADYSSGTHGIVGQSQTYTGSDQVYKLNDNQLTQCFCSSDGGVGIQTNWWKYDDLSEQDLKILERQGWILIPNGSLWGLDQTAYLTRNENYSCSGGVGGSESTDNSYSSTNNILGISRFANTGLTLRTGIILIGLFAILLLARKALNRLTSKT